MPDVYSYLVTSLLFRYSFPLITSLKSQFPQIPNQGFSCQILVMHAQTYTETKEKHYNHYSPEVTLESQVGINHWTPDNMIYPPFLDGICRITHIDADTRCCEWWYPGVLSIVL